MRWLVLLLCGIFTILSENLVFGDEVKSLPNVTWNANFKTYSGYLNAGSNGKGGEWKMFYWLVEAQNNASTAPVLLWFNGGPGCSSFGGMFEELGPFYINRDSSSLYENIYSWNKYANVLAIESPIGVGFSYDTTDPAYNTSDDDTAAKQNHDAINDFFANVHPEYKDRDWYISGESYAGVYIPTMTDRILTSISKGQFNNTNFKGIAIGNGYMNVNLLLNSLVLWDYYHGIISLKDWQKIKTACCNNTDVDICDFSVHFNTSLVNQTSNGDTCGNLTMPYFEWNGNQASNYNPAVDAYNWYQDCYLPEDKYLTNMKRFFKKFVIEKNTIPQTADSLNYDSTDNQRGYSCWNDGALKHYLNNPDVIKAFNVDDKWKQTIKVWSDCNGPLYNNFNNIYTDTSAVFVNIFKTLTNLTKQQSAIKNFRILVYNGDVDTVCNFLGDAIHMDNFASNADVQVPVSQVRQPWWFRNQISGYHQPYAKTLANGLNFNLDVVTVKGSGHFVPNDRPGPSMQMITNFMWNTGNYSNTNGIDVTPHTNDLQGNSTQGSGGGGSGTGIVTNSPFVILVGVLLAALKNVF